MYLNKIRLAVMLTASVALASCSSLVTEFASTGDIRLKPRAEGCDFKVYTTSPKKPFDEVGVVDIGMKCGWNCPTGHYTISGVKKVVAKDVCQAGGNAILLWEANGYGAYNKAVVIWVKN